MRRQTGTSQRYSCVVFGVNSLDKDLCLGHGKQEMAELAIAAAIH